MLLTDDGTLQHRLTDPRRKTSKTYLARMEDVPGEVALQRLRKGVSLKDGPTMPASVRQIREPALRPRPPPIRYRTTVPTSWLEISLREGRNRQVRRMTAAVGYPTLRPIRIAVGKWRLGDLSPGEQRAIHLPGGDNRRRKRRHPPR